LSLQVLLITIDTLYSKAGYCVLPDMAININPFSTPLGASSNLHPLVVHGCTPCVEADTQA